MERPRRVAAPVTRLLCFPEELQRSKRLHVRIPRNSISKGIIDHSFEPVNDSFAYGKTGTFSWAVGEATLQCTGEDKT